LAEQNPAPGIGPVAGLNDRKQLARRVRSRVRHIGIRSDEIHVTLVHGRIEAAISETDDQRLGQPLVDLEQEVIGGQQRKERIAFEEIDHGVGSARLLRVAIR
jgi:hypothetical protein